MAKKGIDVVGDIVNKGGEVLRIDEIRNRKRLHIMSFDYLRVRSLVKKCKESKVEKTIIFQ